jgi:hypothetical protein
VLPGDERAQALTLEGVTAAVLLLAAIGFALQVTAVTPLSSSTSSQHVQNQLQATTEGVLTSTDDTGALQEAVLSWNESEDRFHDAGTAGFYRSGAPPNAFGAELERTLDARNVAYNVVIHYHTEDGDIDSQQLVSQGSPSDNAVSASRTLVVVDDDRLVQRDGSPGTTVSNAEFYMPDANILSDGVYNVVRVEVVAWRV